MKTVYTILTCLFASLSTLCAQNNGGTLLGKITTSDGKPAPAVSLSLDKTDLATASDEYGSFAIRNIEPGNYTLNVTHTGLQSQQFAVRIQADKTEEIKIQLYENARQLQEVIVTATRSLNNRPVTAGKVNIAPMDNPQSIAVIGQQVLNRQQVLQLSDALQNVTGVYVMGTTGGYQEEIAGRGYSFTSNNTFKNGVRYNNGVIPEMSSVDKLEFIKGGSAILYGNVAAGGLLNIVTKKPKFEKGGEISFRTGSNNFYKPSIDIYGALNQRQTAAFRVNTSYQKAASFRDIVSSERFYINPSFLFKLGKKTELLLEGDYLNDDRNPDFGVGAIDYVIAPSRSRYLNVNWSYNKAKQITSTATLTHHINDNWQVKAVVSTQDFQSELFSSLRPTTVQADGTWIRGLQKSRTEERYYIAQADITGKFSTGNIKHTLLLGADADKYDTKAFTFVNNRYNSGSSNAAIRNQNIYDTINIFDASTFNKRQDVPSLATDRITTSPISRYGIYVQDLIAISEKIKLLAGVRYSMQNNEQATVDSVSKGGTLGYVDAYKNDAFSPRVGLVYQPVKQVSLFTSYTNTFNVNAGVDVNNEALKPSIIDQYEAGIKTEFFKGALSANATAYKIINSNFAQNVIPAPAAVPSAKELAGQVTSNGFELDIMAKPMSGFNILAGYSYNETRYTRSNIYKTGERLRYNPSHTANMSVYYKFCQKSALKGFEVGAGAYYVGDRLAGRNPSLTRPDVKIIELPDYVTVDASLGYTCEKLSIRVKLSNLLNQLSYNAHDDNSVNPIAPRQLATTVAFKL